MADMALDLVTGGIFHSNSSIQKYIYIYTHTRRIYVCVYVYTDVNIYSYYIYIYTTIHCYYVVQDAVLIFAEQMPGSLFWALKKLNIKKLKIELQEAVHHCFLHGWTGRNPQWL